MVILKELSCIRRGSYGNGKISQVGIWTKKLTPIESAYLYNNGDGIAKGDWD